VFLPHNVDLDRPSRAIRVGADSAQHIQVREPPNHQANGPSGLDGVGCCFGLAVFPIRDDLDGGLTIPKENAELRAQGRIVCQESDDDFQVVLFPFGVFLPLEVHRQPRQGAALRGKAKLQIPGVFKKKPALVPPPVIRRADDQVSSTQARLPGVYDEFGAGAQADIRRCGTGKTGAEEIENTRHLSPPRWCPDLTITQYRS